MAFCYSLESWNPCNFRQVNKWRPSCSENMEETLQKRGENQPTCGFLPTKMGIKSTKMGDVTLQSRDLSQKIVGLSSRYDTPQNCCFE